MAAEWMQCFQQQISQEHSDGVLERAGYSGIYPYKKKNIPISPIYGEVIQDKKGKWITTGAKRTGCMYCLFGIQFDKEPNRIQQLAQTHPQMYQYILDKLGFREVMDFMKIPYEPVQ